jgi:hypothetical protein
MDSLTIKTNTEIDERIIRGVHAATGITLLPRKENRGSFILKSYANDREVDTEAIYSSIAESFRCSEWDLAWGVNEDSRKHLVISREEVVSRGPEDFRKKMVSIIIEIDSFLHPFLSIEVYRKRSS